MATPQDHAHALIYWTDGDWRYRSWGPSGEIHYDVFLTAGDECEIRAHLWRFVESDALLGPDAKYRAIRFTTTKPDSTPDEVMRSLHAKLGSRNMSRVLRTVAGWAGSDTGLSDEQRQLFAKAAKALRS